MWESQKETVNDARNFWPEQMDRTLLTTGREKAKYKIDFGEKIRNSAADMLSLTFLSDACKWRC